MIAPSDPCIGSVKTISAPNALQNPLALGRDVLRHAQPHAIAARRADHRVGDAGVARRRVEDDLVARQRARPLAVGNHPGRRPILHRAAGILPLGLGVELDVAQTRLEARQADQGRIADQIDDGGGRSGKPGSGDWHIRLVQSGIISVPIQVPSPQSPDQSPGSGL